MFVKITAHAWPVYTVCDVAEVILQHYKYKENSGRSIDILVDLTSHMKCSLSISALTTFFVSPFL